MTGSERALAFRDAAEVVHAEARWHWELDKRGQPCAQIVAQRMQVIERTLIGFAERIENGETDD